MLYSQSLLHRYISFDVDLETIAKELTDKSCEVEETHQRSIPSDVVIAKVISVKKHSNADKLVVCSLDCGKKGIFQICTGAINIVEGNYVPVALPGCFLPAINLHIQPREMRGEDSHGMICSKNELGIGGDAGQHWIWTLQSTKNRTDKGYEDDGTAGDFDDITEKDLGVCLAQKYPWLEGWVLDVENKTITHRPDMFGHFGLGVELQTIFPESIRFNRLAEVTKKMQPGLVMQLLEHASKSERKVAVTSPYVSTYLTVDISGVTISPSDFYTQLLLEDCNLQSKSNRVDFSNMFMLSSSQPIHFFDAAKITGAMIIRQAKNGEKFKDLFGVEHELIDTDIVIADEEKILALGGIVGSESSGIDSTTKNIIAEIANFDPVIVRKTGTRLGLRTDAELRFEKYINPFFSLAALELFLDDLEYNKKTLGDFTIGGITVYLSNDTDHTLVSKIPYNRDAISNLMYGNPATNEFMEESIQTLNRLGFQVKEDYIIPAIRRSPEDCTREVDITEEVARIKSFNSIEEKTLIDTVRYCPLRGERKLMRDAENLLVSTYAASQIETYPWLDKKRLQYEHQEHLFEMQNSLDPSSSLLRRSMIWSIYESLEKNAPFFEQCFVFDRGRTRDKKRETPEHTTLSLGFWDKHSPDSLNHGFLKIKGALNNILTLRECKGKLTYQESEFSYAHPKQQLEIMLNGKQIGTLLTIHPSLLEDSKLASTGAIIIGELDASVLKQFIIPSKKKSIRYETLQDQIIRRDLSFTIDKDTSFGAITKAILQCKEISDLEPFDMYSGEKIAPGKKSLAVRIKIVGDGALQTNDINSIMEKAIANVEQVGGELR